MLNCCPLAALTVAVTHDLKTSEVASLKTIPQTALLGLLPLELMCVVNQSDLGREECIGIVAGSGDPTDRLSGIGLTAYSTEPPGT